MTIDEYMNQLFRDGWRFVKMDTFDAGRKLGYIYEKRDSGERLHFALNIGGCEVKFFFEPKVQETEK